MYTEQSSFTFNTLKYIQYEPGIIPCAEGIYKWVYWPNFEHFIDNEKEYWDMLCMFSTKKLAEVSNFSDYKFEITVVEATFKQTCNQDIVPFGLSENKVQKLKRYIQREENREKFNSFLATHLRRDTY